MVAATVFGSKRSILVIFIWSMFTLLQGFVDIFSGFGIIIALFTLRFLVGLAGRALVPGNSRIVAAWFPAQKRNRGGDIQLRAILCHRYLRADHGLVNP
jgi:MFS family permease